MTGACVARLSEDRNKVLCGHQYPTGHYCATERNEPTELAWIESQKADDDTLRFLVFASDWEDDGRGVVARTATTWRREQHGNSPTRRSWLPTIRGGPARVRRGFVLSKLVRCPQCKWLNSLDAEQLDVVDTEKLRRPSG